MTTFSVLGTDAAAWWEIQHRYPGHERSYYGERWATTDISQFGRAALDLVRKARDDGHLDGTRWDDEAAAVEFLAPFAVRAEKHKTMEFRVARVAARIEVSHVLSVAPPPICGRYGYYGRFGSRATLDLYCQQDPGHEGEHGPRKEVA